MISTWQHKRFSLSLIVLLAGFAFMHCAQGAQLYRYKDDQGKTVLNSTIPPQYVGKGYDILNERGRLIERVPPALTPEQIAAREAEKERQKQLEAARLEQQRIDNELRQLYSHPDDAVRVLKRRIQDIEGVIQVKLSQIESTESEIIKQEGKAANIQRSGRTIPESIIASIKAFKNDIENAQADIAELRDERSKVFEEFDTKIKRLEVITQKKASDYTEWLQSAQTDAPKNGADTKPES